jgi:hypothetical protein
LSMISLCKDRCRGICTYWIQCKEGYQVGRGIAGQRRRSAR